MSETLTNTAVGYRGDPSVASLPLMLVTPALFAINMITARWAESASIPPLFLAFGRWALAFLIMLPMVATRPVGLAPCTRSQSLAPVSARRTRHGRGGRSAIHRCTRYQRGQPRAHLRRVPDARRTARKPPVESAFGQATRLRNAPVVLRRAGRRHWRELLCSEPTQFRPWRPVGALRRRRVGAIPFSASAGRFQPCPARCG